MGKKAKIGKNRQDKFYHLAKEQGFRSRASFKLVQLNKRFDFLSSASRGVLDLCAAPGGWMQVARKHMPVGSPCIGVDLVPIRPVAGCIGLVGDITTEACRIDIRRSLKDHPSAHHDGKVDAVLNDGSPNMGKAWLHDAYTQSELALAGVRLATDFLAPGGTFVTKVFRSADYNSLMFVMNQLFRKVNATKPSASRAESAEIYVLCTGYRAPKSIDARLLNPKYVFKDMGALPDEADETFDEKAKRDLVLSTVLKGMTKRKRHREGYADGALTLYNRLSALEFVRTLRPVAMLCEVSALSFDPRDVQSDKDTAAIAILKEMTETSSEIISCCDDLKVLARREFKLLLKWRMAGRAALSQELLSPEGAETKNDEARQGTAPMVASGAANESDRDSNTGLESEAGLDEELQKVRSELEAKEKRKKRKSNKLRSALQRKIDMKIILPNDEMDMAEQDRAGLFKLSTVVRAEKRGADFSDLDDPNDADTEDLDSDADRDVAPKSNIELRDAEEAAAANNKVVVDELDHWYKVYLSRKKRDKNGALLQESKDRKRRTKRLALREAQAAAAENDGISRMGERADEEDEPARIMADSSASSDDDPDCDEDIHVGKIPVSSREAALWFAQPIFASGVISSDEDEFIPPVRSGLSDGGGVNPLTGLRRSRPYKILSHVSAEEDENGKDDGRAFGDEEDIHAAARREARKKSQTIVAERQQDGFEIAPAEADKTGSDDDRDEASGAGSESSFHSSDYDTDEKAELVAIGRRMRQSKKEATEILDDAYNRYTFDDPLDLPRWFADPDPVYRSRQAPLVSKEQVAEMKLYIKSLQAAPSKKEAEAKARRRARVAKKVEAMKVKANSIAEQNDVPATARMKAIETLYRQASKSTKSKKQRKKQYVAVQSGGSKKVIGGEKGSKGRKGSRGAFTVMVDKRMKSDKRGIAKAEGRKKKGRK
jgi:AdoMet-dependent rRNA methyltransferase SPB1